MSEGFTSPSNLLVCANGHRMIAGTEACPQCGAAPSRLGDAAPATAARANSSRRQYAILAIAVAATLIVGGGAIWASFALLEGPSETAPVVVVPSASSSDSSACADPAVPTLTVGGDVITSSGTVCLVVESTAELGVGAYPDGDGGQDLSMDIYTADGTYWAAADDGLTIDPEVIAVFEADVYVITVSAAGADTLEPFVLYAVEPVNTDPTIGTPTDALPGLDDCGTDGVPLVTNNGNLPLSDDTPYVCFELTSPSFVKLGAQASGTVDGQSADLRLAVYEFLGDDLAFIRSVDDTFDFDPEFSIDLGPGTYLVEFDTWNETPTGEFTAYFDSAGDFFRTTPASAEFANLTEEDCGPDGLPALEIGTTHTVNAGDEPVVCLTLPTKQRVYVTVASLAVEEDLTIEVIGFETSTPQRWAWNDDSLDSTDIGDTDPALDVLLPAGTYALAASEYFGETEVTSFEITVDEIN